MTERQEFERMWQGKLSENLDRVLGTVISQEVMAGSSELLSQPSPNKTICWTQRAMERFDRLADPEQRRQVMTGCACQYPREALQNCRQEYTRTGDIDLVHRMLQAQFLSFLCNTLHLETSMIQDIVGRGWGLAGIRYGDVIIATKIPKSGYLVEYLQENDPERRRQLYCHCSRVRAAIEQSTTISTTYCYCGAGFYQSIWEEIIQRPVVVELLESVLDGGQLCRVAIHLQPSAEPPSMRTW
jgi:hypothetical protein